MTYKRPKWIRDDGTIDPDHVDGIVEGMTRPLEQMVEIVEVLLEEIHLARIAGIREGFDLSMECVKFGGKQETLEALRKFARLHMDEVRKGTDFSPEEAAALRAEFKKEREG